MNSNNDNILSEPIRVTKHYWIRQEAGFLGKQWSVYHCVNGFEASHITFVTAPEEKEDAIRICKMFEPKKEKPKPTEEDITLLLACAGAFIAMIVLPVIVLA